MGSLMTDRFKDSFKGRLEMDMPGKLAVRLSAACVLGLAMIFFMAAAAGGFHLLISIFLHDHRDRGRWWHGAG